MAAKYRFTIAPAKVRSGYMTESKPGGRRPHPHGRAIHIPVGDSDLRRLGPSAGEAFASLSDEEAMLAPVERPGRDTAIADIRFVSLDCETTGQAPHHLLELGAVAFTMDGHELSFETLVHTVGPINPYARNVHGIDYKELAGAPHVTKVAVRFSRFIAGTVLVEHSADAFDTRLISRVVGHPLDADNLDTSHLAAKLWELKDTIGLERLCNELGVVNRAPHHALGDAEATAQCFLELVKRGQDQFGWKTLGDLLEVGSPAPPRPKKPRGLRPPFRNRPQEPSQ